MNELKIFENKEFGKVRTVENEGKTLFCGNDVAKSLGYANPAKAIIDHCKGVTVLETPSKGGIQKTKFITEGDVYRLITHSKLPSAEKFETWVFDEVLPSIRKTGSYGNNNLESAFNLMAKAFDRLTAITESQEKRLSNIETKFEQRKALLPPPNIKPREHINMIVREYATKNAIPYNLAWNELYRQFSYRTNSNPKVSAKNRNMTILDYIDVEGQLEVLESVAVECLKTA
ncbi:MAG: BRO family protein [Fibrobacter sp.]|nr:BRO family protein [Fibrobacter sp.]